MFSRFFIERPIFAMVISLIIVIAGLVSMKALPVAQYPSITPVQVTVTAVYPGADSKTVADAVAAPIEAQINGVENMLYMTSTSSSSGQITVTVYFSLDTDPDIAQVQVQNRVNLAMPQLPDAVVQYGVSVQKKSSSILMIIALYNKDGRYKPDYVSNYANVYVLDAVKRINGAGQAQIFGDGGPGDAHLDEPRPDGLPRDHDDGHPAGGRQPERPVRGRPDRPAADRGDRPADLPGRDPAPVRPAFRVRKHHPPRRPRTAAPSSASRTSPAPKSAASSTSTTTS